MILRFADCSLDTDTCELRRGGAVVPLEPQVLALLRLLIENRERLVTRDELVERIWDGRAISEAAIASRVKSARRAIGDDGHAQRLIRTVHKLGLRFVAEVALEPAPGPARIAVSAAASPPAAPALLAVSPEEARVQPSLAVLPFALLGEGGPYAAIADALPHDLIAELSRLRWLFVIARGSSFQFRGAQATLERVRAALRVRYCLSGTAEIRGAALIVTAELADTRDAGVVWSERFQVELAAVHELRQRIAEAITGALELQIPLHEARLARLRAPEHLDAWAAYHLGLQEMYRFDKPGVARAAALFERALAREPSFARAYAALSFTHFENAFLNFTDDAAQAAALAQRHAETALAHDPLDPFCNLVMGRAFWLRGELERSLPWLERALELCPNYAQGKYSRGWAQTLLGAHAEGRAHADAALALSPLDPLAYGMLGVRALSHIAQGEPAAAVHWAERAARAPAAHALIEMIAALACALADDEPRARAWAAAARQRSPGLDAALFLRAFPFRDPAVRERIARTLQRLCG